MTDNGIRKRVDWEVCDVKRPLLSVTRIIKAGHTAHFAEDAAWITHTRSKKRIPLPTRRRRVDVGLVGAKATTRER